MPTRTPRTIQQYRREAEQLVLRVTRNMEQYGAVDDADLWMQYVSQYLFGDDSLAFTPEQADFFALARDNALEAIFDSGIRPEIFESVSGRVSYRFRDIYTGRFVARDALLDAMEASVLEL